MLCEAETITLSQKRARVQMSIRADRVPASILTRSGEHSVAGRYKHQFRVSTKPDCAPLRLRVLWTQKSRAVNAFLFKAWSGSECSLLRFAIIIIIIMEICQAPTLRLKALNKYSITHIMYIETENGISSKTF